MSTTTVTEQTPAQQLATVGRALAAHLDANPHLDITGCGLESRMLVATNTQDPTRRAAVLTDWATSFAQPTVRARRFLTKDTTVLVEVTADVHGSEINVWCTLTTLDFAFDMTPGVEQEMTLDELRDVLGTSPVNA